MSGSGGFWGYRTVKTTKLSETNEETAHNQNSIEVNEYLQSLLVKYNDRDVEAIRKHLDEIQKTLLKDIEGLEQILFGGSVSKSTFVEGMSDVDALVILDSAKYKNVKPKELQERFIKMLQQRFPRTDITSGALAVTLKFSDYEVQLLPALRKNGKTYLADNNGAKWSSAINSARFTTKLTEINKANANKVVPVIKIAKSLFSNLPPEYRLSGYHVEALAVDAFSTYNGRHTLYDMTKHILNHSAKRVMIPMQDVTGQSSVIDSYLGQSHSETRYKLSKYINEIENNLTGSLSGVKSLFE